MVFQLIISDNGSQFTSIETQTFAAQRKIKWKFNLAAAPWWGGIYERLVRSTKRCLKKVLFRQHFSYEQMITVLNEITCTINNRPLTFLYEDSGDIALTPNHLLFGRTLDFENASNDIAEIPSCELPSKLKHVTIILSHFWKRWRDEYLIELREHDRYTRSKHTNGIDIGDVVIIKEEQKSRGMWTVGRVEELLFSKDKLVRGAKVRYINNEKEYVISRPINKLYPVEYKESNINNIDINFVNEQDIRSVRTG